MSISIERPELDSFIHYWQNKPKEQVAEELASYSLETKRIPDPYYFEITENGELFSPTARCRVKDTVEDKTGPLGRPEYEAVLAIEQWAAGSSEGSVVWVSPPSPGVYPTAKIIISQIEHQAGEKRLLNRAIILDLDEKECLQFAQNLSQMSKNRPLLACLGQVRATPLILNTHGNSWMYILQELIDDRVLWQSIRNGDDQRAKKEALKQARVVQKSFLLPNKHIFSTDAKMAVVQMLGSKSGSCPVVFKTTAFQSFAGSALTIGSSSFNESDSKGSLSFPCPACKFINKRPREGFVETCQNPACPNPKAVRC